MVSPKPVLPVSHVFSQLPASFISKFDTLEMKTVQPVPVESKKKIIFHSGFSIIEEHFLPRLHQCNFFSFVQKYEIQRVSFDIGPCFRRFKTVNNRYVGIGKQVSPDEIERHCAEKIEYLKAKLPGSCEIAIENLNYYNTPAYEGVCLPEFYNKLCRKFGMSLVLDLPHAQVTAWNLSESFPEHIERFDLSLICEYHISKMDVTSSGEAVDSHREPDDAEFALLYHLLKKTNRSLDVVIEYYRNPERIVNIYSQMNRFFLEKNKNHSKTGC